MSAPTQQSNQPGTNQIGEAAPVIPPEQSQGMVTPMNMPGAAAAQVNMPPQTVHPPQSSAPKIDDVETLKSRAAGLQELARKFEQTAKDNEADANAFRKLQQALGGEDEAKADPMLEIAKLRADVETERVERMRSEVARLMGVPPSLITGQDADSMATSAQAALEWGKGLGQKPNGVPLVAPANTVTSDDKPGSGKPQQIQTRDELKGMSSKEIMTAYNEGRMDHLLGKPT